MLKKFILPAVVLACTGLACAQTETTAPAKKTQPAPTKTTTPAKPKTDKGNASLKVGDAAPAIQVDKWVKGEPVTGFEKGKVYVVEFWATWCPPCLKSIPHLTELQKQHKDITIIGVAASEKMDKDGSDNRLAKLEKFVEGKGDAMGYVIAYDADRQMWESYMTAAGKTGIPCAFIVNGEGKIAWIGNPLSKDFDAQVEKAKSGKAPAKKDKPEAKPDLKKQAPAKEEKK